MIHNAIPHRMSPNGVNRTNAKVFDIEKDYLFSSPNGVNRTNAYRHHKSAFSLWQEKKRQKSLLESFKITVIRS